MTPDGHQSLHGENYKREISAKLRDVKLSNPTSKQLNLSPQWKVLLWTSGSSRAGLETDHVLLAVSNRRRGFQNILKQWPLTVMNVDYVASWFSCVKSSAARFWRRFMRRRRVLTTVLLPWIDGRERTFKDSTWKREEREQKHEWSHIPTYPEDEYVTQCDAFRPEAWQRTRFVCLHQGAGWI